MSCLRTLLLVPPRTGLGACRRSFWPAAALVVSQIRPVFSFLQPCRWPKILGGTRQVLCSVALGAGILLGCPAAFAHIDLDSAGTHKSRYGISEIKRGPCGRLNGKRGSQIYTYEPGATIHVAVNEFIPHPSYFRFAFDEEGDGHFMNPRTVAPINRACQPDPADHCGAPDFYNNKTVLMDNLNPHMPEGFKRWEWDVKLPDVECDNCTLQLIQVMTDDIHAPYDPAYTSEDIYYQCVDIVLKKGV